MALSLTKGNKMSLSCPKYLPTIAVISRIAVFVTQILSNHLIPDHDADVFNPPAAETEHKLLDAYVFPLISGFKRWDAVYFLHIAQHGYTYQNCLVFFPLFPGLVRLLVNTVFLPLQLVINYATLLIVGSVLLNNILFTLSVPLLYRLGVKVTNNQNIALLAAILFCFNPASIFMSAPYTETLFLFCVFLGMLQYEEQNIYAASIFFSLGSVTRSNGITFIGYLLYSEGRPVILLLTSNNKRRSREILMYLRNALLNSMPRLFICAFISVIPFLIYQYYSYLLFCTNSLKLNIHPLIHSYGMKRGYVIQGNSSALPWCDRSIPFSYSAIQKQHWGLGLFSYFEVKQIPNFVLAAPVIILSFMACRSYCIKNMMLRRIFKFNNRTHRDEGYGNERHFPYVVHLMFLTVFGIFFMHIQVLTRLLFSSCPSLYWFIASEILSDSQDTGTKNRDSVNTYKDKTGILGSDVKFLTASLKSKIKDFRRQRHFVKFVIIYFISYFFVGIIMFANFLPWT